MAPFPWEWTTVYTDWRKWHDRLAARACEYNGLWLVAVCRPIPTSGRQALASRGKPVNYPAKELPMKIHARGFTLIEILIVVLIVGILSAIAIPQYTEYVLKGKLTEAMALLSDLQIREEQYYQDNRVYANNMTPRAAGQYFTATSCVFRGGDTQTYLCTANAPTINYTYTINEVGTKTTTTPAGGTPSPCWLRSSSTTC
jgi:type IV pilus assembly protein PilE